MLIGGLQKFSLLDYPEHLSAVVFTQGCNFRCQFCYNPMLVWPKVGKIQNTPLFLDGEQKGHPYTEDDLFNFLKSRAGKLDAVVITGGEPTIHHDLPEFITRIKQLEFNVKLDTNGTNSEMLSWLIKEELVDYIAMDIKAAMKKYDLVVGVQPDLSEIKKSAIIIKDSGLPHEFRTTVVPKLVESGDIAAIGELIKGADKWFLQQFNPGPELINAMFQKIEPYSAKELEKMRKRGAVYVKECAVR